MGNGNDLLASRSWKWNIMFVISSIMSDITLQGSPKCDKFMFSCYLDTAEVTVLTWGRGGDVRCKVEGDAHPKNKKAQI